MKKITVSEAAVREFVNEALDGNHLGDLPAFDEQLPVNVNKVVDPSAAVTDLINPDFVPQTKPELEVSFRQLMKSVPVDDIADVYKSIRLMVNDIHSREEEGEEGTMTTKTRSKSSIEESIRKTVRSLLSEINPKFDMSYSGTDYGDSDDDDDDDTEKKPKRAYKTTALGNMADVDGESFESIAKKLGFSVAGAKQAVDKALEKARFLAQIDEDDKEILVLTAMNDYIKMLSKGGTLSAADVKLMKDHPDIVRELDGFREFLHTHVRRARRKDAKLENPLGEAKKRKLKETFGSPLAQASSKRVPPSLAANDTVKCPECGGDGEIGSDGDFGTSEECPSCLGHGRVNRDDLLCLKRTRWLQQSSSNLRS